MPVWVLILMVVVMDQHLHLLHLLSILDSIKIHTKVKIFLNENVHYHSVYLQIKNTVDTVQKIHQRSTINQAIHMMLRNSKGSKNTEKRTKKKKNNQNQLRNNQLLSQSQLMVQKYRLHKLKSNLLQENQKLHNLSLLPLFLLNLQLKL